ncbi:MAG: cold shock domain-containing protein [Streptosporangiaceae bacterium]|nr:cold shock domain-containing protein [Streptosporangiaceae bacterium]
MATGRVLQFDPVRGYGFVAADDGGEDVFLHASVFDGDPELLVPGKKVRFQVMAGDRGRKAFAVHLVSDEPDPGDKPARPAPAGAPAPAPAPAPAAVTATATAAPPAPVTVSSAATIPAPPASPVAGPPVAVKPGPVPASQAPAPDEEQMCDVLSPPEFRQEITELLLDTVPELTGQHVLQLRQNMLEFAKKHGWIDG